MYTKQETFDIVAKHLIEQGRPAANSAGNCMYRTDSGLKCAVGCLIPDDLYSKGLEDISITCFNNEQFLNDHVCLTKKEQITKVYDYLSKQHNIPLLKELQEIHDWKARTNIDCCDEEWLTEIKEQLHNLAVKHRLRCTV